MIKANNMTPIDFLIENQKAILETHCRNKAIAQHTWISLKIICLNLGK